MQLEDVVDIDIGYDAPPPSFTAGMKLMKKRRARIEAANKQRIDAIRKAPAAPAASTNHSQPGVRNEDACPPHKLAKKKREGCFLVWTQLQLIAHEGHTLIAWNQQSTSGGNGLIKIKGVAGKLLGQIKFPATNRQSMK
ncbi:uncharacterized protein C2845_PM04G20420 [Panicum miliaceum]|uniref:Uncharacterized protein n=1 Tax=Panicum miliaceum TaxID=4540 RepID=A0A3L6QTY0_PANMI|nr:uncharacterized protein C2845_PM04G20420 [Panicum miliaceum]